MGIGACSYVISFLLVAVQRYGDSYWAFIFPALILCVVGADFEFNVANVSSSRHHLSKHISLLTSLRWSSAWHTKTNPCVQMYVLSALPPHRQSIAGSIFQTVTKLCVAVGYGITTAIFNAVSVNPSKSGYYANDPAEPYAAIFWFSMSIAVVGVALVPLLTIGTQGHEREADHTQVEENSTDEKTNMYDEKIGERAERGDGDVEKELHGLGSVQDIDEASIKPGKEGFDI